MQWGPPFVTATRGSRDTTPVSLSKFYTNLVISYLIVIDPIIQSCCKIPGVSHKKVRYEVLTAAGMKMPVFWNVAPCSPVEVYRRFRGFRTLKQATLKRFSISATAHDATSHKTLIWSFTQSLKKEIQIICGKLVKYLVTPKIFGHGTFILGIWKHLSVRIQNFSAKSRSACHFLGRMYKANYRKRLYFYTRVTVFTSPLLALMNGKICSNYIKYRRQKETSLFN
jgi:hypothetical protein